MKRNDHRTDRRTFLRRAAAAGVSLAVLPHLLPGCAAPRPRPRAAGRLRHAAIGTGGMGAEDLAHIASHPDVDIVALCDVDAAHLAAAAALHPGARTYSDWRLLLEREAGLIDSVHVTVPDHMHAPIAASAIALGLHVYCQKPLTHTVLEARRLTEMAEAAGVVTQMGIQNRAGKPYRQALNLFSDGILDERVRAVYVWTDRPAGWWAQGVERSEASEPVPEGLDWDGWLGVAPERPYASGYHPFHWRGRLDFGTGAQGDMACHLMDPAPWFLELGAPLSVRSVGPAPNAESFPEWSTVHYRFEATQHTVHEGVDVVWYDGGKQPTEVFARHGVSEPYANACLFVGDERALLVSPYEPCRLFGKDGEVALAMPDVPEKDHWHEFVDACLDRGSTVAPFSVAGPLTEIALLGNVALFEPGVELAWGSEGLRFPGSPAATARLHKAYRRGWAVPGLEMPPPIATPAG